MSRGLSLTHFIIKTSIRIYVTVCYDTIYCLRETESDNLVVLSCFIKWESPLTTGGLDLCVEMRDQLECLRAKLREPVQEPRAQLEYIKTIWDPTFDFLYHSDVSAMWGEGKLDKETVCSASLFFIERTWAWEILYAEWEATTDAE